MDEDSFSFLKKVPAELSHGIYCSRCFDDKVAPQKDSYDQTLIEAKNINVFYKNQGKITRFMKRKEEPYKVENCIDKDEALMKLCFQAVKDEFNSLIDIDIIPTKTMQGTYKIMTWAGTAVPINLTEKTLVNTGNSY
jgi:hypothetical protein